eukprot:m.293770 g.293770  ORF g.293770 m.293770 type:complete len:310 (-) comp31453_c0_seq1:24-953(-)
MASEIDILRSRLEEQSELIMLLKRRNEEAENKLSAATAARSTARASTYQNEQDAAALESRLQQLQLQFDTLSSNHEKLVAFKDDYKQQNSRLRVENEALQRKARVQEAATADAVLEAGKDLEQQLHETRAKEQALHSRLLLTEKDVKDLQQELNAEKIQHAATRSSSGAERLSLQEELATTRTMLETKLAKLQLCLDQQQQQYQNSIASVKSLKKELDAVRSQADMAEVARQQAETQRDIALKEAAAARQQAASNSTDALVAHAQQHAADARRETEDLRQEYLAFKQQNQALLQKEKDMNARLRRLTEA